MIPQIPKMCDDILVTLMKMQPYYSQCDLIHLPITWAYRRGGGGGGGGGGEAKNNASVDYVRGCLTVHNPLFSVNRL